MRAIRVHEFGGPEVLRLEDVPDPQPGAEQVLVQLRAAGVNPVETYIRSGNYALKPRLPYTPGSDGAGDVVAVGEGVDHVKVGDRVYVGGVGVLMDGTYAEKVVVPKATVWPLPERVTYEQGAAIAVPAATAYRALFQRAHAQPGEWVLVHGASGAVGTSAVQLALALGCKVIGTAGTAEGQKVLRELGAQHVFDHGDATMFDRVREATGGRGMDVIVEMLANVNLGKDLPALALGGRVIVVGSRGPVEINPRDIMSKDAAVLGMINFNTPPADVAKVHAGLGAALRNGTLVPVVGKTFRLAEAPAAQRAVIEEKALGKVVLVP
ncbi:MAG: NADPH:quinone reductase [Chloroflexi bacterium]|nr:NADPH:quinone reductase [Chloroflexota bacterium]